MYIIELDRWNIKQGLPSKPYKDADYIRADTNIQGINNAIQYANANGYTHVILPRGQYALCYPREIKIVSNMTFDLNSSTLKVIYDSERKSPFDTRTTTDYYKFGGFSIVFENVTNSHLIGGTIIGCRDDRSFQNAQEASMEGSYGVAFTKGTNYSSVKSCIVRDYMGDNITFSSNSIGALAEFNPGLTLNALDYNTGQPISSTNTVITGFINLPQNLNYDSMMITGFGYSRLTNLVSRDYDVFFYTENNIFLGVMKKRKIYTDISIPLNAKKFRLLFYNESNQSKTLQFTIRWGSIPHHNLIEHNEIFNGHRGGITLGGSYNVIQHNVIRDNGKGSVRFLDGKPIFTDPTRYSINQEDSYGDNCVIRNNLIYGSYHGLLVGCYSIQIENNHIYNIDNIAINLYSMLHATISGNFIYNCLNNIGLMSSNFENAYVNISGNSIHGGSMSLLPSNSYYLNVTDNNFVDVMNLSMNNSNIKSVFKNNLIKYSSTTNSPNITINKIQNCIFDSSIKKNVTLKSYELVGCVFNNFNIDIRTFNDTTLSEKVTINQCEFTNSMIINNIFVKTNRQVTVSNSKLYDTIIKVGNINSPGFSTTTIVESCDLISNKLINLFATDINAPGSMIKLNQCNIEITNPNFTYLIDHEKGVVQSVFTIFIKNSNIKYTSSTPLKLNYYDVKKPMIKFISAENEFTNISFPPEDPEVFIGYDIDNTYKENVTLQIDGDKYSAIVVHNLNTFEPYVFALSDASEIMYPIIKIIDNNSISIKNSEQTNLNITVKKL